MFTTPLRELPTSSVATLENGISGGTVAFAADAELCCAKLNRLHNNIIESESTTARACFIKCLVVFLRRPEAPAWPPRFSCVVIYQHRFTYLRTIRIDSDGLLAVETSDA